MPNSVLWVCLVAIWLFVLVPMVIKGRPEVRKTTEATLATRVINRGGRAMARATSKVASGRHPHDADWVAPVREYRKRGELINDLDDHADTRAETDVEEAPVESGSADTESTDTVAASTADTLLSAGEVEADATASDDADADTDASDDAEAESDDDLRDANETDSTETDGDTAAAEYEVVAEPLTRRGRGGYDAAADSRRSETRYRSRQRIVLVLATLVILSVGVGVVLGGLGWVVTGVAATLLLGYMTFLRRAVRVEERIRRQRAARAARAQRNARPLARDLDDVGDPLHDEIPEHLRRPGAVVLEIDDEHPVFEHLPPFQRRRVMREDADYRHVVGQ